MHANLFKLSLGRFQVLTGYGKKQPNVNLKRFACYISPCMILPIQLATT